MTDPIQNEWNRLVHESRKAPAKPHLSPDAPPPEKRSLGWKLPTLLVLSIAALVLHARGTLAPWPAEPSPAQITAGHQASLLLAAKAIHDYAAFHGKYPQSLADVLPLAINIDYRMTDDGFELKMLGPDGTPIVMRGK
jgi:hypothetical protein